MAKKPKNEIEIEQIDSMEDNITEEEIELASQLDEEYEKDEKKEHKRVYKSSSQSEEVRKRFIDICKRYNSDNPEIKKQALGDAIDELKSFVHYVIKKKYSTYGKYYEDLTQEGIIGIIKGMEKYDPTKSLPTTFFNVYIIHEMSKFVDTEVNKTTSHYSSNLTKINRVIDRLEAIGQKWTPTDIAVETGLNMETIIQCLNIKEYKNEMYYETAEILDANVSEREPSPEQTYIENERNEILYDSIKSLLPEEQQVLLYRYGLNGANIISYKEIAKEMNISIERVRKYRHDAIRKLKHKTGLRNIFKDYIDEEEDNILNESTISLIQTDLAESMMQEIEEIDFDFEEFASE